MAKKKVKKVKKKEGNAGVVYANQKLTDESNKEIIDEKARITIANLQKSILELNWRIDRIVMAIDKSKSVRNL